MLANFGKVQAWMLTPADIVNERARGAAVHVVGADAARSWPR